MRLFRTCELCANCFDDEILSFVALCCRDKSNLVSREFFELLSHYLNWDWTWRFIFIVRVWLASSRVIDLRDDLISNSNCCIAKRSHSPHKKLKSLSIYTNKVPLFINNPRHCDVTVSFEVSIRLNQICWVGI